MCTHCSCSGAGQGAARQHVPLQAGASRGSGSGRRRGGTRTVSRAVVAAAVLASVLAGCGGAGPAARVDRGGAAGGALDAVERGAPIPAGAGAVLIRTGLKTRLDGRPWLEAASSPHGAGQYPFAVSVGGRSALWEAGGSREPAAGADARDPEAGEGMRYVLEKRVFLPPGEHALELRLPVEGYAVGTTVTVREGVETVVEARPVYRYAKRPQHRPSFLKGLSRCELSVDGRPAAAPGPAGR